MSLIVDPMLTEAPVFFSSISVATSTTDSEKKIAPFTTTHVSDTNFPDGLPKPRKMSRKHFKRRIPQKLNGVEKILIALKNRLQSINDEHHCTVSRAPRISKENASELTLEKNNNNAMFPTSRVSPKNSRDVKNIIKKKTFSDVEKLIELIGEIKTLNENHPSLRKLCQRAPTGLEKLRNISREFALFADWNIDSKKSRCDVTQKLCNYIKENKLQREKNLREFVIDSQLSNLFGFPVGSVMTFPNLQKHLHLAFDNSGHPATREEESKLIENVR